MWRLPCIILEYDILFLDIELFRMTGIEAGDFIRNRLEDRSMQIIYISGKSSYARELFKTQPMDFLVKPITQQNREQEFYGKLRDVSKKLSDSFLNIHHSYIVNPEYVLHYAYDALELMDGTILPISKANRKQIRERILRER